MTREDIIKLAGHRQVSEWVIKLVADAVAAEREEFAAHAIDIARRAIAEEREACAKVCEDLDFSDWQDRGWDQGTYDCANAIRARGQQC